MTRTPDAWVAEASAAAVSALEGSRPRCGTIRVLTIDGRSGSGKSVLAARVAAHTGAPVLALDDLYPGWEGLRAGLDLADRCVLEPLANGDDALAPTWDWNLGAAVPGGFALTHDRVMASGGLLVVEGCGAGAPPVEAWASWRVWLDCDERTRRSRALARDGAAYAAHWDAWAHQEEAVVGPARAGADQVVPVLA